jgi:hypothetical protein
MQGRGDEARTILEPAMAYYESEQKAGAHGMTFRYDFAYALYARALARPTDGAGRAQRSADLAEAARLMDGASAEARRMTTFRNLVNWISTARAS